MDILALLAKPGDIVRVKMFGKPEFAIRVIESDPRGFVKDSRGSVYALCNKPDEFGPFYF
jgi:hypothetical protein